MQATTSDLPIDPSTCTNSTTGRNESWDIVEVLEQLVAHSIPMRPRGKTAARSKHLLKPPFARRVDLIKLARCPLKTRDSAL